MEPSPDAPIGLERGRVRVAAYDPSWPSLFREEAGRIRVGCGNHVNSLEHVGSTAVPGQPAKPILDILAGLAQQADGLRLVSPMERLGYEYMGEHGIVGRHYFVRRQGNSSLVHVHAVETNGAEWRKTLAFRDALRSHPHWSAEYASLKQGLAERYPQDRGRYTDAKQEFIASIIARLATS